MPAALLFDMDGTLTDAREPISQRCCEGLEGCSNSIKKHLVTGSDMVKIEEQIPNDNLLQLFERVLFL